MPLLRSKSILFVLLFYGSAGLLNAQPAAEILPHGAVLRLGSARLRHLQAVRQIQFTPDGKHIATIGMDDVFAVWNLKTGAEVRRVLLSDKAKLDHRRMDRTDIQALLLEQYYGRHAMQPTTGAISADGRFLIHASEGAVRIAEAVTGAESARLQFKDKRIGTTALSADGKRLVRYLNAMQEQPAEFHVMDVATGKTIQKLRSAQHEYLVRFLFSDDGKYLAGANSEAQISLWDLATGKRIRRFEMAESVAAFSFLPNTHRLMAVNGSEAAFFDLAADDETAKILMKEVSHRTAAIAPDGKTLAATGADHSIILWDIASGIQKCQLDNKIANVTALAFSADGTQLAAGTFAGTTHLWDLATLQEITPVAHRAKQQLLAYLDERTILAKFGQEGEMQQIDIRTGKPVKSLFALASENAPPPLIAPNGKLSAHPHAENATIQMWDTEKNREVHLLEGHAVRPGFMSFSNDSRWLASLDNTKNLRIWNLETGKHTHSLTVPFVAEEGQNMQFNGRLVFHYRGQQQQPQSTPHLVFSRDCRYLIALGLQNNITIWDLTSGKERGQFLLGRVPVNHLIAAPDSRTFATVSSGEIVRVWNALDGSLIHGFVNMLGDVRTLAFSPSSKHLAIGTESGAVVLYDLVQGKEQRRFLGHRAAVTKVLFSPDGDRILSASDDATYLFWDVSSPAPSLASAAPLSEARLAELWEKLGNAESVDTHKVFSELIAHSASTTKYFHDNLKPVPVATPARLQKLVRDLDDLQFTARESATQELIRLDIQVLAALQKAMNNNPTAELSGRAKLIAEKLDDQKIAPEHLRSVRAIEVLERIADRDAIALLESLAGGTANARLTLAAREALRRCK